MDMAKWLFKSSTWYLTAISEGKGDQKRLYYSPSGLSAQGCEPELLNREVASKQGGAQTAGFHPKVLPSQPEAVIAGQVKEDKLQFWVGQQTDPSFWNSTKQLSQHHCHGILASGCVFTSLPCYLPLRQAVCCSMPVWDLKWLHTLQNYFSASVISWTSWPEQMRPGHVQWEEWEWESGDRAEHPILMWILCLEGPAKRHPCLSLALQQEDDLPAQCSPVSFHNLCVLVRGSAVSPRRKAGWCSGEGRRGGDVGVS